MSVSALVRAALIVADLDRSHAFYRDLLGLPVTYWEGPLDHPATHALLGLAGHERVRARIVQAPGPPFGMVGLFAIDPAPPRLAARDGLVRVGEAILVFNAPDLDPIVERLRRGGHPVPCPPVFLQVSAAGGQREMLCLDPDGTRINIIERPGRLA